VFGAVIAALGKWWGGAFGGWQTLAQIVNFLLGFELTTAVFAMIYKLMPRVKVRWHDVLLGAVVTALLFTVGKFLIGLYIGKSAVASSFGAAGSLVVVFVWVYYSTQVFLLGAEFTWAYARQFGSMRSSAQAEEAAGDTPQAAALARGSEVPKGLPQHAAAAPIRRARQTLAEVGVGLAAWLALRYVVPRILRRF